MHVCGPPSSLAFLPPPSRPPLSSPSPPFFLARADGLDFSSGRSAPRSARRSEDVFDDREWICMRKIDPSVLVRRRSCDAAALIHVRSRLRPCADAPLGRRIMLGAGAGAVFLPGGLFASDVTALTHSTFPLSLSPAGDAQQTRSQENAGQMPPVTRIGVAAIAPGSDAMRCPPGMPTLPFADDPASGWWALCFTVIRMLTNGHVWHYRRYYASSDSGSLGACNRSVTTPAELMEAAGPRAAVEP
ncbi:hypothetical protein AURDEDRAFT_177117 [Auricularia subglabra TFB-10046 SS5]|uniref:Uncharacterized protein n=1 Tax=Auricularia subglabra (strain TFB-10046 / SS5) TaxID=717982 RepID=J0D4X9_AURST|nr:hypothetical protein AURDEDRAFT_177117 [Auricularia subglabra TFB-10046 SS5]